METDGDDIPMDQAKSTIKKIIAKIVVVIFIVIVIGILLYLGSIMPNFWLKIPLYISAVVTVFVALMNALKWFLDIEIIKKYNKKFALGCLILAAFISIGTTFANDIGNLISPAEKIKPYKYFGKKHDFSEDDTEKVMGKRFIVTIEDYGYDDEIAKREENDKIITILDDNYTPAYNKRYIGKIDDKQSKAEYLWDSIYYDFEFVQNLFITLCTFAKEFDNEFIIYDEIDVTRTGVLLEKIEDIIDKHGTFEIAKYIMIVFIDIGDALTRESSDDKTKILAGVHIANEFYKACTIIGAKEIIRIKKSGDCDPRKAEKIIELMKTAYNRLKENGKDNYDNTINFLESFKKNPEKFIFPDEN